VHHVKYDAACENSTTVRELHAQRVLGLVHSSDSLHYSREMLRVPSEQLSPANSCICRIQSGTWVATRLQPNRLSELVQYRLKLFPLNVPVNHTDVDTFAGGPFGVDNRDPLADRYVRSQEQ